METLLSLANGFSVAIEPSKLLFCLIGVFLGTAVGVLPGIGPALTVALLLPVTFKLDPVNGQAPRHPDVVKRRNAEELPFGLRVVIIAPVHRRAFRI